MKNLSKYFIAVPFVAAAIVVGLSNCTHKDQVLDLAVTPVTPTLNTDTLHSVSGTATLLPIGGAAWDGTIGGEWGSAPILTVHAVVPDLGNQTFVGYVGNSTDIKLRSLHDANNIYFLVEFNIDQRNVKSTQWYFNPTQTDMTQKWAQESFDPAMNPDLTVRPPFQQDGFAFMWNISFPTFNATSCYAACHVNSSYGGTVTPASGEMYTNGPSERLDMWRARSLQFMNMNQSNDCFLDDGSAAGISGALNNLGLNNDDQDPTDLSETDGDIEILPNIQTLTITGPGTFTTTNEANVPMWMIYDPTSGHNPYSNNGALLIKDTIATGAAKKVVAVDSNGVLTLSDGHTVDPRIGTDYKQLGSGDGPKSIPGGIAAAYTGSRGDVTVNAFYNGTTSVRMLFKRALKTSDTVNDVDFSSLKNQPFGVGAFFNGADNEHAIVAGLILHFKN